MNDEEKAKQQREDMLFEAIVECFDYGQLLEHFRAEYQRGFKAGAATGASKEQMAAEYERGQNDYRDNLLKELDAKYRPKVPDVAKPAEPTVKPTKPIATSIVEVPKEKPSQETAKAPDGAKVPPVAEKPASEPASGEKTPSEPDPPRVSLGGRPPKAPRPNGIPTNFEMSRVALQELGKASAPQIRDFVRRKWWPSVPSEWTSVLWGFAEDGRLVRDGINFVLAASKPDPQKIIDRAVQKRTEPRAPSVPAVRDSIVVAAPRREIVTPGAKLGPPARGEGAHFKHGDKIVVMHPREVDISLRLRAAMNSGHLDAKFLANSIGIKSDAEATMRDFVTVLNLNSPRSAWWSNSTKASASS